MNLLDKLFSKTPNAADIRVQLKEIERDQRKKRRDLDEMIQTKQQKVQEAVAAKKGGKQELVRDIFRDLRQIEIDNGYANNDLRRLSLTKIALTSFLRKVELLEQGKDRKGLQRLVVRFKESPIQKAIDRAGVDDDTFNNMLEEILEEQDPSAKGKEKEDAGFAAFDRAIEEMAKAEGSTDLVEEALKTVKSPDHSAEDLLRETVKPSFPGLEEADAAGDPCKDSCYPGTSANYSKMHATH